MNSNSVLAALGKEAAVNAGNDIVQSINNSDDEGDKYHALKFLRLFKYFYPPKPKKIYTTFSGTLRNRSIMAFWLHTFFMLYGLIFFKYCTVFESGCLVALAFSCYLTMKRVVYSIYLFVLFSCTSSAMFTGLAQETKSVPSFFGILFMILLQYALFFEVARKLCEFHSMGGLDGHGNGEYLLEGFKLRREYEVEMANESVK